MTTLNHFNLSVSKLMINQLFWTNKWKYYHRLWEVLRLYYPSRQLAVIMNLNRILFWTIKQSVIYTGFHLSNSIDQSFVTDEKPLLLTVFFCIPDSENTLLGNQKCLSLILFLTWDLLLIIDNEGKLALRWYFIGRSEVHFIPVMR